MKILQITTICIILISIVMSVKVDFVTNGDFASNVCSKAYCIWNTTTYKSSYVQGWFPEPEIEVGVGSYYSDSLKNNTRIL